MKTLTLIIFLFAASMITLFSCSSSSEENDKENKSTNNNNRIAKDSIVEKEVDTLTIALDWTPNVLHSGLFWAIHHKAFVEEHIYVKWFTPEVDNYTKKPIQRLMEREVDLSVGPSEHLFFFAEEQQKSMIQAVGTFLQNGRSCFVVKEGNGIQSPKDLDGKTYLGYHTPFEKEVLSAMIKHDGGEGELKSVHPKRLEVWDAFMADSGHIAWVFYHWESAEAESQGVNLRNFFPQDYGVPYGYSSVIMARKDASPRQKKMIRKFLKVMSETQKLIADQPSSDIVEVLQQTVDHPNYKDSVFLKLAVERIQGEFLNDQGEWGTMDSMRWNNYLDWLHRSGMNVEFCVSKGASHFYTNEFFMKE